MINLGFTLLSHSSSLSERLVRGVQRGPISSQPSQSTASSAHSISGQRVIVQQYTQAGQYIKRPSALNRMEIRLIDKISASNSCNYTDKCTIVSGQVKKNPEYADRRQRLLHYCYRRSFVTPWEQTARAELTRGFILGQGWSHTMLRGGFLTGIYSRYLNSCKLPSCLCTSGKMCPLNTNKVP